MAYSRLNTTLFLLIAWVAIIPALSQNSAGAITFRLEEEQPADTSIGNVAEEKDLRSTMSQEEFDNLRYQILSSDGPRISSLFTINSRTGELFTNAMIDREQVGLCDSGASTKTCSLAFDVTVKSDLAVIRLLNVIVEILDKNDNPPTFPSNEQPISIPEDSQIGSEFLIPGAVDKDTGLDATVVYWMDDTQLFTLREEKLLDSSVLYLSLNQKLDRETRDSYQLRIYAKDGNTTSSLTGTLLVKITVADVNDHDPEFILPMFNFTVEENATPGNFVGKLEATDLDAGLNGQIQFNFSSLTSNRVLALFRLDPKTGDIYVKSTLQYESNQEFRAVVEAKDRGETPRASQANLIISVVDSGNTPPRLSLTLADLRYQDTTLLSESLPVGSFVGTLKYSDNDDGDNGRVECHSLNSHFELQSLESSGYGIEIKTLLDRETESEMTVRLQCSDHGTPSLSAFANFTVMIDDINDNRPVFLSSNYLASVSERVTVANNIIRVSATDRDEGVNSEVTYQLTANSSNAFSVDPFSGWISLKSPVDREGSPVIHLTVLAVDGGSDPQTGSVTVSVTVEDVNDNAPEIVRKEYSVRENEEAPAFVSQISAMDRDEGPNGDVIYSLLFDAADSFSVSESGVISTKVVLDREAVPFYLIVVGVSDKGVPSLTTSATLSILVTDINDHIPVIRFPTPGNDSVVISANLSPGSFVARVVASDRDVGKNAKLLYLIAEGNPHKIFSIDNTTGTVFLANRPNSVRQSSYHLTISVQDGGNPRQHTKTFLNVDIDFTNATILDAGSGMEHKYVIIAGVISGITVVVAVVVIAIILKLRHGELSSGSNGVGKVVAKSESRPNGSVCKSVSDYSVPVPGYKLNQTDREAGFDPEKSNVKESNSSLNHQMGNGNGPYCHRPGMTQDYANHHTGSMYPAFSEGRQRLTSEDIHSNTSSETTTSDSGRGASDAEEITNAVFQHQSIRPSQSQVPTIPPREPFTVARATTPAGSGFQGPSPCSSEAYRPGDNLSRAARAYASHKALDKIKRPNSKVRFSLDDHSVGNSRFSQQPPPQPPPPTYFDQLKAARVSSPIEMNIKPSSLPSSHGNGLNDLSYSSGFSSAASTRSADGDRRSADTHNTSGGHFLSSKPHHYRQDGGARSHDPHRNIISQSNGGIPVHRGGAGNRISQTQPIVYNSNNSNKLAGSSYRSKDSSYPLLRPPMQSRSQLSSLNHSVDEDDDDGGSTTTSGSYAIDDHLNISVEC